MIVLKVLPWAKRFRHLLGLGALAGHSLRGLALITAGPTVRSAKRPLLVGIFYGPAEALDRQGRDLTTLATVTGVPRNDDVGALHGLLTARAAARLLVELAKQLAALFVAEVLKLLHLLRRQGDALCTNLGRAEQAAECKKRQGSDVAFYVFNHSLCCFRMGQRI